ncbi:hypothetical protein AAFF_G00434390 [Aldrovandia affinis]|uniref:Uncharacterized protein n=1 Tax=Aldrovandia affinis TaxID=143900 RepID=A0AAD7S864_9TELE|nr:hypothetical protein AAFF_G00434390 [Aldrovandia affinis]
MYSTVQEISSTHMVTRDFFKKVLRGKGNNDRLQLCDCCKEDLSPRWGAAQGPRPAQWVLGCRFLQPPSVASGPFPPGAREARAQLGADILKRLAPIAPQRAKDHVALLNECPRGNFLLCF